jgi:hypothetical protein
MENRETGKKRKITVPLMLLGVVALIGVIVFNIITWQAYIGQQSEVGALEIKVEQVNKLIAQAAEPPTELQAQLAQAQADLEVALSVFPQNVDRNDVFDFILATAEAYHVQIIPLIAEGEETGGTGRSYKKLKYHGTVTGSLGDVSSFMTALHYGKYPSMLITDCTLQRTAQEGSVNSINDVTVVVDISLAFYVSSVKG